MGTLNRGNLAPARRPLAFPIQVEASLWESRTRLLFSGDFLDLNTTVDFRGIGQVSKRAQHA